MNKYTPLHALLPGIGNEIVCVRVARLWYHRGGRDQGPVKNIQMVLMDNQVHHHIADIRLCNVQKICLKKGFNWVAVNHIAG